MKYVFNIFAGFALSLATLVFFIPWCLGGQSFSVEGSSMHPTVAAGDLVTVEKVVPTELKINDLVTYRSNDEYVTHRLKRIDAKGYLVVGDNDTGAEWVQGEQIEGKVMYRLPALGYAKTLLSAPALWLSLLLLAILAWSKQRRLALTCFLTGLLGFAPVAATTTAFTDATVINGTTFTEPVLGAPVLSCSTVGLASVNFSWTSVSGATSYTLYYNDGAQSQTVTGTSAAPVALASMQRRAWVVANRAFNTDVFTGPKSNEKIYYATVVAMCQNA